MKLPYKEGAKLVNPHRPVISSRKNIEISLIEMLAQKHELS